MTRIVTVIIMCLLVVSCANDDDKNTTQIPQLLGNWRLIETYSDPGDGSGDFVEVESDKTVTFGVNGSLQSNGNLCEIFSNSGTPSEGVYSQEEGTINIDTCGIMTYLISFEIVNGHLIISHPCIEACQEKYTKVNN